MWTIFALIIFQLLLVNVNSDFKINPSPIFPFPSDTISELEISPKTESDSLITSVLDTMVVRVTDGKKVILDCAKFTYGKTEFIDNEFKGEFIEIPSWRRSDNRIKISLLFKKKSAGKLLEIFILQTNSNEKCMEIKINKTKIFFLIKNTINLSVLFKLNLKVESVNRTTGELLNRELAVATCQAFGVSSENPSFLNYIRFNLKNHKLLADKKERKLWFQVSLSDHEKILKCKIRNMSKAVKVLVHHYPTKILTNPKNLENVEPGSEITCYTADGFPKPKVQWKFISGPQNISSLYSIIKNGTTLKLKSRFNKGTKLIFKCTAENVILGEKAVIHKTISIIVRKSVPHQCSLSCVDSRLTLLEGLLQSQKNDVNANLINFQTELKSMQKKIKKFPDSENLLKLAEKYQNLNRELIAKSTGLEKNIKSVKNEYNRQFTEIKEVLKNSETISEKKLKEHSKDLLLLKTSLKNIEKKINKKKIVTLENSINTMKKDIGEMKIKSRQEIIELRNEIESLKEIIKVNNKLLPTTYSSIKSGSPQPNRQHYVKFVVDKIAVKRKNNQNIQSPDYLLDDFQVVTIRAEFQDFNTGILLQNIEIYLSFMNKRQSNISVSVKSTIEISNTKDIIKKISITKYFHINLNYGTSPVFYFNYNELINNGILLNDSITISCLLIFNN